jgi:hypothetical protein
VVHTDSGFGILAIPDEDPPGNQVTTRVQKLQLLSHGRCRFAQMLTPRSIPGEIVTPRIRRHAPSCYILVTKRASQQTPLGRSQPDGRFACAFLGLVLNFGGFLFPVLVLPSRTPQGHNAGR